MISRSEIIETNRMFSEYNLDVRTITLGLSLLDCAADTTPSFCARVYDKICKKAEKLVFVGEQIGREFGVPIVNKRISVTPVAIAHAVPGANYVEVCRTLDQAAETVGVNFIGGFSALVHKGASAADGALINSLPEALSVTERVCASVNVGSTKAGLNMTVIRELGHIIKRIASSSPNSIGCAKFVVFCNSVEDNPFMAGAYHGVGEGDCAINVGVSGPGVVNSAIKECEGRDFETLCETIKKTAFRVSRVGQLVALEASKRLDVPFGVIDLSLAPTPAVGDSIAEILQTMGVSQPGAPGSTAAIALLNDNVKKGGIMASSCVGGLSGAFIPVSEDGGMIDAVKMGALSLDKLEALTSVCSVGIDMVAIPGDTPASSISGIIADEAAIGMINNKTTAVRIIPAHGKQVGDELVFGGLLGSAPVMPVSAFGCEPFISRGGRIPAPVHSFRN